MNNLRISEANFLKSNSNHENPKYFTDLNNLSLEFLWVLFKN